MEERQPIKVQSLTRLKVIVDHTPITVSLCKRKNVSDSEHLDIVYAELRRKILKVTLRDSHDVLGNSDLSDSSFERIFTDYYGHRYEDDLFWLGDWEDTTGAFALMEPSLPVAALPAKANGPKKGRKVSTIPSEVRSCNA